MAQHSDPTLQEVRDSGCLENPDEDLRTFTVFDCKVLAHNAGCAQSFREALRWAFMQRYKIPDVADHFLADTITRRAQAVERLAPWNVRRQTRRYEGYVRCS